MSVISKANTGGGAVSTFTAEDTGFDMRVRMHRVVVDAALAPFKVEMRVPSTAVWVELADGLTEADEGLIDAYGYDSIRVTCDGAAGDVYLQVLENVR